MDGEGGTGGAGVSGDGAAGAGAGGGSMGDAGARSGGGSMGDAGAGAGGGSMGDAGARGGGGSMGDAGARGGGGGGRARLLMQQMLASDDSDDDDTPAHGAVTQEARGAAAPAHAPAVTCDESDVEYVPNRAPGPKKKKSRGPWSAKRAQLAAGPGAGRPGPRRLRPGRPGPARPGPGKLGPGTPGRKGPGRPRRSLPAPAAAKPTQDTAPGNSRDTYDRHSHRPNGNAPAARRPAPAAAPGGGQPPPATHNGTDSSNSLMDWLAQDSSCSEDAPSGEFVQLAVTRVHAPAPSSRSLLAVLAHAASAPAQAALLLECLPEVSAAPAQTRVTHALCRAGDEPMRDYRFQEPETPPPGGVAPARAALVQLADAEREWSGELARLRAQTAAHAHTLRDVRAVCTAPPPPSGKLRAELDELLRCVKDYHDALNDVQTSRESGEAALEDAVQQVLLRAVAGLEKDSA